MTAVLGSARGRVNEAGPCEEPTARSPTFRARLVASSQALAAE